MNNTANTARENLKKIADTIAAMVKQEAGAAIEVTFRHLANDGLAFTVSGRPAEVAKAKPWFGGRRVTGEEYDAELDEAFVYYNC